MLQVPIWGEVVPTLALIAVGVLALRGGYWRGKSAWYNHHAIHLGDRGSERTVSGEYGELAVFAMVAVAIAIVMVFCPDAALYHADGPEFAFVVLWFAGVYAATAIYAHLKTRGGPSKDRKDADGGGKPSAEKTDAHPTEALRELREGYHIYNFYSCILFGLGGLALAKVALQFRHDWEANAVASRRLVEQAEALLAIRPAAFDLNAFVEVERAYLSFRELLSDVLVQVEPIAFLFLYVTAIALVVSMTPVSRAYGKGARRTASSVSVICVVVLLAISLGSYFLHATVASRELVASLSQMKTWPATDVEHYIRYSEIYREVKAAGGFSGFIRALLSEAVFLVLVVGVAQQAASGLRILTERANR